MVESKKRTNGAGSVRPLPKNAPPSEQRYVGTVTRGGAIVKRVYGQRGKITKVEELIVWAKLKPWLNLPATVDAASTLLEAILAFIARRETPATRDGYRKLLRYIVPLTAKRMIEIKPDDVEAALDAITPTRGKKTMARTREKVYILLKAVFAEAVRKQKLSFNPVGAVDTPSYRIESDSVVFTPEEQGFLREEARGTPHEAMLLLSLGMPLRTCELVALRRQDVNLSRREVEINHDLIVTKEHGYEPTLGPVKTDESHRMLPLGTDVLRAITKLLEANMAAGRSTPESFLFVSKRGEPIRHSNLTKRWWKPLLERTAIRAEAAARKAGDTDYRFPVHAGLYDLRHTAIENLKAAGVPLDVLHRLCGHRSLATTMTYYNNPTQKRRHAAASAVEQWLSENGSASAVSIP